LLQDEAGNLDNLNPSALVSGVHMKHKQNEKRGAAPFGARIVPIKLETEFAN